MRKNAHGVILDYGDPGAHLELKIYPSDRLRCSVLKAAKELATLCIIVEHLDLSDIGYDRIAFALHALESALNLVRDELGMGTGE
jgi:hypothetical protein